MLKVKIQTLPLVFVTHCVKQENWGISTPLQAKKVSLA
jgi:hypothetical protein